MKKVFVVFFCVLILLGWGYSRYSVPVLMYHSINYEEGLLYVKPEVFQKHMEYLKRANFQVISLDEFLEIMRANKKFPRRTVVITFDDGYRDNFTYAYPVLKKYNFPAVIFLVTGRIGRDERYLNWDEVKKMAESKIIDFGGHTRNHIYLPSIKDEEELWGEIYLCKEDIEKNTGIVVKYFSYPVGGFTDRIKELVKKAGYSAGLTTNRGYDLRNLKDFYEINRISVRNDNLLKFMVKVSGYYNIFREGKPPH
ncbi:MAG: polysaccharide deacetylase family protein [Candidatus Omnitrophota bacterium]